MAELPEDGGNDQPTLTGVDVITDPELLKNIILEFEAI